MFSNNKQVYKENIRNKFFKYSFKKFSVVAASVLIGTNAASLLTGTNVVFGAETSVVSKKNSANEAMQTLNKIIDGDFEGYLSSQKQMWTYNANGNSKKASEGNNSFGSIGTGKISDYVLQVIPTVPGQTYKLSADIKVTAKNGKKPEGVFLTAKVQTDKKTQGKSLKQISFTSATNGWEKKELEFTADSSYTYIGIVKWADKDPKGNVSATEISIDNVVVNEKVASDYDVLWYDEFSGENLNQNIWRYELGSLRGNEQEHYVSSKENVFLRDDHLVLKVTDRAEEDQYDNPRWINNKNNPAREIIYNSGDIATKGKLEVLYGRIEMRAKLPKGKGAFPAFWTLGNAYKWPSNGELDILEMIGAPTEERAAEGEKDTTPDTRQSNSTLHGTPHFYYEKTNDPDKDGSYAPYELGTHVELAEDLNEDYHIFGINWTPEKVEWYIDGVIYNTMYLYGDERLDAAAKSINAPQHLKINLATGGNWAGDAGLHLAEDNTEFVIDWVRWGQNEDQSADMEEYYKTQPVLSGVRDFTITQGSTTDLLEGVSVDKEDYIITCSIDNEYFFNDSTDMSIKTFSIDKVNTLEPGVYNINYMAQPKGVTLEGYPTHKVSYKTSRLIVLPEEGLSGIEGNTLSTVSLPKGWEWQDKNTVIGDQETYPVIFKNVVNDVSTGNERTTLINVPLSVTKNPAVSEDETQTTEDQKQTTEDETQTTEDQKQTTEDQKQTTEDEKQVASEDQKQTVSGEQNVATSDKEVDVVGGKDSAKLPNTGGQNSTIILVIGLLFVAASAIFLYPKKKYFGKQ